MSQRVLSKVSGHNPILELRRQGLTTKEIKDLFIEVLNPYFEHRDALEDLVTVLAPEAVGVARIQERPEKEELLRTVIGVYRASRLANQSACFESCAFWEQPILDGMSEYWSQYYLELDKAGLPIEEFKYEVFRNIGVITEACLQPILRDLLAQVLITEGKPSSPSAIAELNFGAVVAELYRRPFLREVVASSPWKIPVSQWRNIAQHHKSTIESGSIRGVYGKGKNEKSVLFSRPELFAALTDLHLHWAILRGARTMFLFDNLDKAQVFFGPTRIRDDVLIFQLHSSLATQGFVLVDITRSEGETRAVVKDITDEDQRSRLAHCSQFVLPIYVHIPNASIVVDYTDKNGTPVMRFRAKREHLDQVKDGRQGFEYLAQHVTFESLK